MALAFTRTADIPLTARLGGFRAVTVHSRTPATLTPAPRAATTHAYLCFYESLPISATVNQQAPAGTCNRNQQAPAGTSGHKQGG
ncbi:hypothetical protein E2C01_088832 [Portunus trituberculatus]|uniref:Uncharacterized protein n=1 Tax=Portunus trituberculatus TaxID=210409 RepID=A0A5B7JBW1_PORTR|nr:hypothetical protein [Portunus trituberculatus]